MPALNHNHLFEQADHLATPSRAGRPRQVDLRRAISSAYYGCFHLVVGLLADEFVGAARQGTASYSLVYRKLDHSTLKALCNQIIRPRPEKAYQPYLPSGGFGPGVRAYAAATRQLQEQRHQSDYDPLPTFSTSDAIEAIATAREAAAALIQAPADERQLFLTLLLCPPRS